MQRKARVDAPEAVHHFIVRGIVRRKIFRSVANRAKSLVRLVDCLKSPVIPGAITMRLWERQNMHGRMSAPY